jgi:heme exporter protein B
MRGASLNNLANIIKAIFIKDFVSEFRSRQVLPAMIVLGILIAWVFRTSTESALVDKGTIASAALLVSLLFSMIMSGERSFAAEHENDCINGLLLATTDASDIYIAKLIVNIAMLCIFELISVPAIIVLFELNLAGTWFQFITTLLLINIGMAGIGTLMASLVQGTRAQSSMLSVLVLAVLCPMMVPAIFALLVLFGSMQSQVYGIGVLSMVGTFNTAIGFLAAFDAIFVTVCWLLFGFAVAE